MLLLCQYYLIPFYHVGWYDLFIVGNLLAYDQYNSMSDSSVRYTSKITIDPLGHCLDGVGFFTENMVAGQGRTALILGMIHDLLNYV